MTQQFIPTSGGAIETRGGTLFTLGTPTEPVEAVVDSFESGDLAAYSGDTTSFSVIDTSTLAFSAKDGTYVLSSNDGATGEIYSLPGDGLPAYLSKGNEARVWLRFGNTPTYECRLNFGWADGSNNYLFRVQPGVDTLELGSESAGSYSPIGTGTISPSIAQDTWYEAIIIWDDGTLGGADNDITIQLRTEDGTVIAEASGNNADNAANEGIAFRAYNSAAGDTLFWDDFRIITGADEQPATAWIDNFEDQSFANYSTTNSIGDFAFETENTVSGSTAALQSSLSSDGSGYIISNPGDGLANYPARGDHIRGYLYSDPLGGVYQDVYFTHTDSSNYLMYEVEWSNDRVQLVNTVAGSAGVPIDVRSAGISLGVWYQVDIYWHDGSGANADGDIRIVMTNMDTGTVDVDATDNVPDAASGGTHAGGPHGFRLGFYSQGTDEFVLWDDWRIV